MTVTELFSRRLLLFTGKGGVGKSTVVASLALAAKQLGKRPLIVELDTESAMRRLFRAPELGHSPRAVDQGIYAVSIAPQEALADYLETHVKVPGLVRLILRNSLLRVFFRTAPGVYEFVTLHKLLALLNEADTARPNKPAYDLLLVDLPATGHAIRLLSLPQAVRQMIGVGPLRKIVEKLEGVLSDPQITALSLVTLPEELPVAEAIELYDSILAKTRIPLGMLFVNACPERLFDQADQELLAKLDALAPAALADLLAQAARAAKGESKRAELLSELAARVRLSFIRLPSLLIGADEREALSQLARATLAAAEGVGA